MVDKTKTPLEQFRSTSSGQRMLKEHSLTDTGVWQVLGEDSNADFSGPHHQPTLGYFEGTLADVIDHALSLPRYWSWGGGGDIRLIKITPVDKNTVEVAKQLRARRAELEAEQARIAEELKALGQ